jgi:uncharacterized membrane protein
MRAFGPHTVEYLLDSLRWVPWLTLATIIMVAAYATIAVAVYIIGWATTRPVESRCGWAVVAAVLWPVSLLMVVVYAISQRRQAKDDNR